jgi:hypothetical protein
VQEARSESKESDSSNFIRKSDSVGNGGEMSKLKSVNVAKRGIKDAG